MTYLSDLRVCACGEYFETEAYNGLLHYDGVYYGDVEFFLTEGDHPYYDPLQAKIK
jgi:hypothetical protein